MGGGVGVGRDRGLTSVSGPCWLLRAVIKGGIAGSSPDTQGEGGTKRPQCLDVARDSEHIWLVCTYPTEGRAAAPVNTSEGSVCVRQVVTCPSPSSGGAMCSNSESTAFADCCGPPLRALATPPPRPLSFRLLVESCVGRRPGFGVPSTGGFLAFWVELLFVMSPRTFRGVFCGNGALSCLPGFSVEGRRKVTTVPRGRTGEAGAACTAGEGLDHLHLQHVQKRGTTTCCFLLTSCQLAHPTGHQVCPACPTTRTGQATPQHTGSGDVRA